MKKKYPVKGVLWYGVVCILQVFTVDTVWHKNVWCIELFTKVFYNTSLLPYWIPALGIELRQYWGLKNLPLYASSIFYKESNSFWKIHPVITVKKCIICFCIFDFVVNRQRFSFSTKCYLLRISFNKCLE